jgi:hypothetical protein
MLLYDNKEDAYNKLASTICYYDGHAVYVRQVIQKDDGSFIVEWKDKITGGIRRCPLNDPLFNCMNFNLGYSNAKHSAVWWARTPHKQYRQGLRADQMISFAANPGMRENIPFEYNNTIINMLENKYPDAESCKKILMDGAAHIMAFHKNFASTYDDMHKDIILEYKGKKIGITTDFKKFALVPEYEYLTEYLREAINV